MFLQQNEILHPVYPMLFDSSRYTGGFPSQCSHLGLLIHWKYSDRPIWEAKGREMTLYCSKSIGGTCRGHYQKSGVVCLKKAGGHCSRLEDLWSVMWVTWNAICWILFGQGELTHLWQEAKSTLIYATPPSRRGPAQSPSHYRRCIVRGSTVSKNNHSQRHTYTHKHIIKDLWRVG